ncbi:MAG: serine hydrolase domain-containing protein [Planctomycetaceae bacterium]
MFIHLTCYMERPTVMWKTLTRHFLPMFLTTVALASSVVAQEVKIAPAVQPFVEKNELAGAVMLVANKEKVLTAEVAGWADIAAKKPMALNSVFWIASQSKPITGAALMVLVDEGKVSLDDPVEKYLPEFRGQMVAAFRSDDTVLLRKPKHPITVRNVLAHTSGLPFQSAIESPTLDMYPLHIRVRSYAMTPLDFEPDSNYQYSNAGINVAARIIEVVAKTSFEKFLDERFFQPLGMKDTTFWPNEEQAPRIATAYKPGKNNMGLEPTTIGQLYYPLTDRTQRFPMPAGGLFSTAHDMARFYQMLLNDGQLEGKKYLSADAVKALTSRQTPTALKNSYGLGFAVSETTFGHGGAYSTNSNADKQNGLIVIWLVQHAGFPGEGGKSQEAFKRAAYEAFSKSK